MRFSRSYKINAETVVIPADAASIARGMHIAESRGCGHCHGPGLGGGTFMNNFAMGRIEGPNLTRGEGGIGRTFTDADWVRAIRHGVGPDGKPLIIMPADENYYLSDQDLGALIAYLKQLPPMNQRKAAVDPGPVARTLFAFGKMNSLVPAEMISHDAPRPEAPAAGVAPEYGEYLTRGCIGCHGNDLGGAPPVAPGFPPAPSLHKAGPIATWSEAEFVRFLRSGTDPSGRQINPQFMPWPSFGKLSDEELAAIWAYLRTL